MIALSMHCINQLAMFQFIKPYKGTQKKTISGWNDLVLPFKTDSLE